MSPPGSFRPSSSCWKSERVDHFGIAQLHARQPKQQAPRAAFGPHRQRRGGRQLKPRPRSRTRASAIAAPRWPERRFAPAIRDGCSSNPVRTETIRSTAARNLSAASAAAARHRASTRSGCPARLFVGRDQVVATHVVLDRRDAGGDPEQSAPASGKPATTTSVSPSLSRVTSTTARSSSSCKAAVLPLECQGV